MIDDVTYVDRDRRAARFFADVDGVTELVAEHSQDADASTWRFIHADYRHTVQVLDARCDLLISLYASLVSNHRTRLPAARRDPADNPSHGDVARAALDPRSSLAAIITIGHTCQCCATHTHSRGVGGLEHPGQHFAVNQCCWPVRYRRAAA